VGREKLLTVSGILWGGKETNIVTFSPYPGAIEKFCKKSDKFMEVT
jgi:hypothetical protein